MSNMKCPFCQQELETWAKYTDGTSKVWCSKCNLFGDSKLFSELIRTRKALDVAVDALKSAHEYYEHCVEREKQPYEEINWDCTAMNMDNDISEALEQITALEQKE